MTRPSTSSSIQSIVLPPGTTVTPSGDPRPQVREGFTITLAPVPSHDFPDARLHIVTGKGGTGKSTVAAALALALASNGTNVLLCEVEGRQGIARMFDVEPLPYAERRIATGLVGPKGERGGVVHALHIDPESALLEYLSMYYKLGRAGKALDRFGVIEFATTIAPGVRDVLLTGKVYEATKRNARNKDAIRYDAVVLDAPPTGRIAQFLGVNDELAGLARMGPIKSQADSVTRLFRSPQTVVPPGDGPRGDAGAGDRRRHRRAPASTGSRSAGSWSTRCGRATSTRTTSPRSAPTRSPRRSCPPTSPGPGSPAPAPSSPGSSTRPATTPSGGRWRTASARWWRPSRSRRTSCRCWSAASTSAGSTSSPGSSATRAWRRSGMSTPRKEPRGAAQRQPSRARTRVGPQSVQGGRVLDVDALLDDRHTGIIVCCGSGGVGKTTTSAALALRAAERGRQVVVLTIDPARRLAQSMGIEELDNTPRPVPGVGRPESGGSLDAMMLDMKRTFDEVVESQASPEKAKQILENPFYIALSSSFAGTQEYMAMEKLGRSTPTPSATAPTT